MNPPDDGPKVVGFVVGPLTADSQVRLESWAPSGPTVALACRTNAPPCRKNARASLRRAPNARGRSTRMTELIWEGKYDDKGRKVAPPGQRGTNGVRRIGG